MGGILQKRTVTKMAKITQKRWFHATTKQGLKFILKEGILWGIDDDKRHTFLARNYDELIRMISLPYFTDLRKCEVVLSVRYIPNGLDDDYNPKWWEMIVTKPIPISNVQVYKYL